MQIEFNPENFKKAFRKAFRPYIITVVIAYGIALCLWIISLIMDTGAIFDAEKTIRYGVFVIGFIAAGGIIVIGINSVGAFAVGVNAVGIVAIGTNAVGVIAIGVNAVGVIAIGVEGYCYGIYALSSSHRGRSKYLFAPHRQDAKAVIFFTKWLPRLAESGFQDKIDSIE